jgi:outer membrane lipoprotein-sorting protein
MARAGEKSAPPAADRQAALLARLTEIDSRAARVEDFTAEFEQRRFTALLKKPLVSNGTVRVRGPVVRWDTKSPEPAVLHSDGKELRMYYPGQGVLEVYPIDQRLSELAASPLPRLGSLRKHFAIAQIPVEELRDAAKGQAGTDQAEYIALRLTPTDDALREHLAFVRVLIDVAGAHMVKVETNDPDGDRTVISFTKVRINTGVRPEELALTVPPATKVTRPLPEAK